MAYLNMSDPQETCPSSLTLSTSPVRGCGRSTFHGKICDSVVYSVSGRSYSSVCGKIIAYHKRLSRGLLSVWNNISVSIEQAYVSGVSITHGQPGARQHVWTFVGTLNEIDNMHKKEDLTVAVLILMPLGHMRFLHSWVMITSVTLVIMDQELIAIALISTSMTHCGMVRGVALLAAAVSSTPLHCSTSLYLKLPQTTWR